MDDLVEGLIRLMNTDDDVIGPMNLGNPDEFTIKSLANKVLELAGSSSSLVYEQLPSDDPKRRRPDISLANKVLGWTPTVKLEEGLKKTIEYFRKTVDIRNEN